MALPQGARIGAYEIVGLIGAGGMGEVYRAQDSRLKRLVAIKVLPDALAAEPDRISRFEREAQLLASLNHPNIAVVHDFQHADNRQLLVMELVEGETLADRLRRGPLDIDSSLQIARQIAEALEAAHQKGIIHRDLKPANIKVSPDGRVKVLDFGLAKIFEATPSSIDATNSPTLIGATMRGIIVGTAAYMSPEQARCQAVDPRTDIWAFGCVVYEMLTGRQAFAGENVSDTVASVLRSEPDWRSLPADTPPRIRVLLRRCLQKESRERLHDIADVRIEIDDRGADGTPAAAPRHDARPVIVAILAFISGAALASLTWWIGVRPSSATPAPVHLNLLLANQAALFGHLNGNRELAISPDGQKIVYVATYGGTRHLVLRPLGNADGRPIEGTDGATTAFFSPDSEWIAFDKGSELQRVAVSGGSPVTICKLASTGFFGGDWGADNTIVFVPDYNAGLWTVSANGGTPKPLLETDVEKDRASLGDPQILPNANGVLFTSSSGRALTADDQDVAILDPGQKEPRILIRGGSHPRYVSTGHILYTHGGALLAVAFDVSKRAITGTPVSVVAGIGRSWSGDTDYSIANNGTLVYEANAGVPTGGRFVLVDRKGNVVEALAPKRGNYSEFSLSPNGTSIATRMFAVNDDIWTLDLATGAPLRLTFEPRDEIDPRWTTDGTRIAFGTRTGTIFWKSADGSGTREELTHGPYPRYPTSFSRDGKHMAFVEIHPSRRSDIWLMALDGDRRTEPLIATDANERDARFSPDGRWLAYVSDETGRDEVFLRPLGRPGPRKQLSSEGGSEPAWSANGRELFFLKGDQQAAITVDGQGNPVGRDRVLFAMPRFEDLHVNAERPLYDVMPDGEHFVYLLEQSSLPPHFNIVFNWFDELRAKK